MYKDKAVTQRWSPLKRVVYRPMSWLQTLPTYQNRNISVFIFSFMIVYKFVLIVRCNDYFQWLLPMTIYTFMSSQNMRKIKMQKIPTEDLSKEIESRIQMICNVFLVAGPQPRHQNHPDSGLLSHHRKHLQSHHYFCTQLNEDAKFDKDMIYSPRSFGSYINLVGYARNSPLYPYQ